MSIGSVVMSEIPTQYRGKIVEALREALDVSIGNVPTKQRATRRAAAMVNIAADIAKGTDQAVAFMREIEAMGAEATKRRENWVLWTVLGLSFSPFIAALVHSILFR